MDRPRRLFALPALSALALALGCAGPPIPALIEGLPVCADFVTGNAKMEGGLRFPVRLRVLDGKNLLYKTIIAGLRHADDPKPKSYIADDNASYAVEWAQCANPRAPRAVSEQAQGPKARAHTREGEGSAYECGDASVYKSEVLTTKKGDRASHVITFVPPPDPACWVGDVPPAPEPHAGAGAIDAGAADASAPTGDAGAAPADAGTAAADAGAAPAIDAGAAKTK